ncbi:hypothetical protein QA648_34275 (plasmid) [Rhizobium sp. CB3171]|nr:hypothetical protein [Rhizobium sp. CB3171]WFU06842.1 hypothetical protein QA648_34275 [Rhizobium sp. CB3171]
MQALTVDVDDPLEAAAHMVLSVSDFDRADHEKSCRLGLRP